MRLLVEERWCSDLALCRGAVFFLSIGSRGVVTRIDDFATQSILAHEDDAHRLAVDEEQNVYYTAMQDEHRSAVIALDRGRRRVLGTLTGTPGQIALDELTVYFTTPGARPDRSDGAVRAVSQHGGAVTTLAAGQPGAGPIAVHGKWVYWANEHAACICRSRKRHGEARRIVDGHTVSDLACDGARLYWVGTSWRWPDGRVEGGGAVSSANLDGSDVRELARSPCPVGIAVDDQHVYWIDFGELPASPPVGSGPPAVSRNGTLRRVPKGGGAERVVAQDQRFHVGARGLAVDATHVYWTSWQGVMSADKPNRADL